MCNLISYHYKNSLLWMRILGHGISIYNTRKHPPAFSVRYGYKKILRLGRWYIQYLGRK